LLDLGKFLYESDVVLANLDEPIDPGVVVEMQFAH
jgi:nucleoside 2-deoxyribosyltransferase